MFGFQQEMVMVECCNCHMNFAMTKEYNAQRRKDHARFHCPAGHVQSYMGQSEEEKLRLERDRLAQRMAFKDDEIERIKKLSDHYEASARTYKGHLTRTKKRVGKGTCPCCNRHFSNVEQHMATKHPEFSESDAA